MFSYTNLLPLVYHWNDNKEEVYILMLKEFALGTHGYMETCPYLTRRLAALFESGTKELGYIAAVVMNMVHQF